MPTYKLIQTLSATSGSVANFNFTSIPTDGTYNDLVLKVSTRSSDTAGNTDNIALSLNGSTSGYNWCALFHNNTTGGAMNAAGLDTNYWGGWINTNLNSAGTFNHSTIYIPNYISSGTKCHTADSVQTNYATGTNTNYNGMSSTAWSGTAAINQITLTPGSGGNFVQYSTASLYGIKSTV
jgi:hypothetical protein